MVEVVVVRRSALDTEAPLKRTEKITAKRMDRTELLDSGC